MVLVKMPPQYAERLKSQWRHDLLSFEHHKTPSESTI
jgi:hypothetical protein